MVHFMVEFMARSIRNELVSKTRVGTQLYAQLEMSHAYFWLAPKPIWGSIFFLVIFLLILVPFWT